jgi:hypothetical protein
VLVRRPPAVVEDGLGEPFVQWINRKGEGTRVFVSPDIREKLKPGS